MKALGYIFATIAVISGVATLTGHPHQLLIAVLSGLLAYAILSSEDEDDDKTQSI